MPQLREYPNGPFLTFKLLGYLFSLFETKLFAPKPRTCLILKFFFLCFFFFSTPCPLFFLVDRPSSPYFHTNFAKLSQIWPSAPSSLAWVRRGSPRDLAELLQVLSGGPGVGGFPSARSKDEGKEHRSGLDLVPAGNIPVPGFGNLRQIIDS